MSHSNFQTETGLTLLEALVSLAVIVTIAAVSVTSIRTPSDRVVLQRIAADLERTITSIRQDAISTNKQRSLTIDENICADEITVIFHPNGMASGNDICLISGDATMVLILNALTGHFSVGDINEAG